MEELLPVVIETGKINLRCMELLDKANTESYGDPIPTEVPLTIEKGPFIVVSGHDLHDMKLLLEQTKDKGINIYTHSEMLPAHRYPKIRAMQTVCLQLRWCLIRRWFILVRTKILRRLLQKHWNAVDIRKIIR